MRFLVIILFNENKFSTSLVHIKYTSGHKTHKTSEFYFETNYYLTVFKHFIYNVMLWTFSIKL